MYVLIHGGFHNNKCWHDVEQILRKNGKKVTSVLLPGHNETDRTVKRHQRDNLCRKYN